MRHVTLMLPIKVEDPQGAAKGVLAVIPAVLLLIIIFMTQLKSIFPSYLNTSSSFVSTLLMNSAAYTGQELINFSG